MSPMPQPPRSRPAPLDAAAKAIVEQLQQDGRRPYAAIGKAVGRSKLFAPHLSKQLLMAAASLDGLVRGSRAKLTADRVGYMSHPNWVSRFDRMVPAEIWQPRIRGEEGLAATATWYRANNWL